MAKFNFEGDLSSVREPHLVFISNVLEKRGYKGSKVVVEGVGTVGDNYMANVKRIIVNENGETFKMIVKLAPENPMVRKASFVGEFFINEEFAYTVMFPKFEQKLKMAGVPESEGIRFPKCYGVSLDAPNEVILLEDLKESGYSTLSRFEPITDDSLKMILRFLAIYHSLSFALRYQEPETFEAYQKKLEPSTTELNDDVMLFFREIENQCIEILENPKHKQIIKGSISNMNVNQLKISKMIKNSKYSVIQHGDAWITNVMFRIENNIPQECLMIDYQMIKESGPANDILSIIFNSTTHKQRSENFYNYIDYYHSELDKSLNNFGLKANLVYPKDRLDAQLKIYGKPVFSFNVISASMATRSKEEAAKIRESMETTEVEDKDQAMSTIMKRDDKSLEAFKVRLEDLLNSYCELGLI